MGAWLARQLTREHQVALYDPEPQALECDPAPIWLQQLADLTEFQPDMVINAAPLQSTLEVFQQLLPLIHDEALLCDIASVKTGFGDYYKKAGRPFVSVHPMFGPTFASFEALREENAIIIRESCRPGRDFFVDLFARLGVRVFEFDFAEHDRMMAYSLTTPFVASLVFAACIEPGVVPGTTFARHKKIARGVLGEDDHLIAEILFNPHSIAQIEKINSRLEFLKHVIRARDTEEARKLFARLRQNIVEES